MKNFRNMFLALSLIFVASAVANDVPVTPVEVLQKVGDAVQNAVQKPAPVVCQNSATATDSCMLCDAVSGAASCIWENKGKFAVAAIVIGAVAYYVSTLDDADNDNI